MNDLAPKPLALRIPADGSTAQLIRFDIKQRSADDGGYGDFFDEIPDLRPWYGDAFLERRFSIFHVGSVKDSDFKFPGFMKSDDTIIHGFYCLYYTLSSLLPINKTCAKYVGFEPPPDRIFWKGDVFLVQYKGDLGMGHEYADILTPQTAIIKDVVRSAYERRALEGILEDDKKFEIEMERSRSRHPDLYEGIESGAIERLRTGQTLSLEDVSLIHRISQYTIRFPDGTTRAIWETGTPTTTSDGT